jgi:hypothetical protein
MKNAHWRPLVAVVAAAYAAISLASTLSGEFASDSVQKAIRLGNLIPHWSGWIWATIGLALLLVFGIEGAFREFRRLEKASADTLAKRLADQQEQHQLALDSQRRDYEKKLTKAKAPPKAEPTLARLQPVYEQRQPYRVQPHEYSAAIEHRIGILNPAGNPAATGGLVPCHRRCVVSSVGKDLGHELFRAQTSITRIW